MLKKQLNTILFLLFFIHISIYSLSQNQNNIPDPFKRFKEQIFSLTIDSLSKYPLYLPKYNKLEQYIPISLPVEKIIYDRDSLKIKNFTEDEIVKKKIDWYTRFDRYKIENETLHIILYENVRKLFIKSSFVKSSDSIKMVSFDIIQY